WFLGQDPAPAEHFTLPLHDALPILEEYLADGWLGAVHPDDRPGAEEAWREALRGRTMFEWSYRARTRASGYRHFEVRAVPIIRQDRKSTRLNSSHVKISYAVLCLKK